MSQKNKEKVDLSTYPEEFFLWLHSNVKDLQFGKVDITIVEGSIESVHIVKTFKPEVGIDKNLKTCIVC